MVIRILLLTTIRTVAQEPAEVPVVPNRASERALSSLDSAPASRWSTASPSAEIQWTQHGASTPWMSPAGLVACSITARLASATQLPLAMLDSLSDRISRVRRWLDCLRPLADASHPIGRAAREELPGALGLSAENVEWALTHALEVDASDDEVRQLVTCTVVAPRAHVILSANVFVGALRAIAIALASSSNVRVRASRREPRTAAYLLRAAPQSFELVTELDVAPGEHVWVYGADTTLRELRTTLPRGTVLHAHGDGHGLFIIDEDATLDESDYTAMALDIAAFDQRGCLSPRYALFQGSATRARDFAQRLLEAMTVLEHRIPFGTRDTAELSVTARHRETWRFLGEIFEGPGGLVTLDTDGLDWGAPPLHRTLHIRTVEDPLAELKIRAARITAVGCRAHSSLRRAVNAAVPHARVSCFGHMQRPRLDGPVDRRSDPAGILLE